MHPRPPLRLAAALVLSCLLGSAAVARADWADGRVPEGDNAFTLRQRDLRLSVLGRSAVGITDRVELSAYLPLYFALFPNLALKIGLFDGDASSVALKLGVGAGAYPVIGGMAVPPFVAFGFTGFVVAGYQTAEVDWSVRPTRRLTVTGRAGVLGLELGVVGVGGVVGPGAVAVLPILGGGAALGGVGGLELDVVLGPRDALVVDASAYYLKGADEGLVITTAGWTHAWEHFHLMLGAYTFLDLPHAKLWHDGHPVGPYANLYWSF
ncbi:MAG TPA: hypothetical protein VGQ83_43575 [Polyangia bacterium]|jgi:hypothetical protein